jgi:hypothetical protein
MLLYLKTIFDMLGNTNLDWFTKVCMLFLVHSIYGKVQLMFDTKQHLSFLTEVYIYL